MLTACTKSKLFDYFILVLQWNSTIHDYWTIHGLWPSKIIGEDTYPCECKYDPFNVSNLYEIKDQLDIFWPSKFNSNEQFWAHEWSKHGTCIPDFTQFNYFSTVLTLREMYDPIKTIEPQRSHISLDFLASQFVNKPTFGCISHYLSELGICLYKNFSSFDCSLHIHSEINSCNENVIY